MPEPWPEDPEPQPWGWATVVGCLVCIDVWLTNLGLWWFGLWPPPR